VLGCCFSLLCVCVCLDSLVVASPSDIARIHACAMNPNRVIRKPPAKTVAEAVWRTGMVVGGETFVRTIVPIFERAGMSIEGISIPPVSRTQLCHRINAQDSQDAAQGKLLVKKGLSPEVIHDSDEFKYVFINGPTFWRREICESVLTTGKHVLTYPLSSEAETKELLHHCSHPSFSDLLCLVQNDLRFYPGVRRLKQLLSQEKICGEPTDVHFEMAFGPPLFTLSPPIEHEIAQYSWWHRRQQGGGALGIAGTEAHDTIRFLTDGRSKATQVRAVLKSNGNPGGQVMDLRGELRDIEAGDTCSLDIVLNDGCAFANIELDWGHSIPDIGDNFQPTPSSCHITATSASGEHHVHLDILSGEIKLNGVPDTYSVSEDLFWEGSAVVTAAEKGAEQYAMAYTATIEAIVAAASADNVTENGGGFMTLHQAIESAQFVAAAYASWDCSNGKVHADVARDSS
jgi:predicted dehydrogenase